MEKYFKYSEKYQNDINDSYIPRKRKSLATSDSENCKYSLSAYYKPDTVANVF